MADNGKEFATKSEVRPDRVRRLSVDGALWLVREIAAPQFDRRGGTHLLFASQDVMRRVRNFPANWFDLPDAELYALTDSIRLTG